ncbi:MAG: type IV pilus modification PilV family protein [Planctomycetota bacterium]|jgi:prepilin-type N-terminal cleavage/methylation domain-containing protein
MSARPSTIRPHAPQAGFSFLEVLFALSILLVGSVAVLSLFAIGTHHVVERRIARRVAQVTPEVMTIVQDAVDAVAIDEPPPQIRGYELSQPDYTVDVDFDPTGFGGPRYHAKAVLLFRGQPVHAFPPIPISRSTFDPR